MSPEKEAPIEEPVVKSENAKPLSLESASENVVIAKSEMVKVEETPEEKLQREIAELERKVNRKKEEERLRKERDQQEKAQLLAEETRLREEQLQAEKLRLEE